MNHGSPDHVDKREFARIQARVGAKIQPLDGPRAERLRQELCIGASVWAPTNDNSIRELANGGAIGPEAILAQAVLELTAQVVRLHEQLDGNAPVKTGWISQLSGGGGRLECDFGVDMGDQLEMRFTDDEGDDIPPIRALIEIVHKVPGEESCGFRFSAIHPHDQKLLMGLIYRIQRRELRRSHTP